MTCTVWVSAVHLRPSRASPLLQGSVLNPPRGVAAMTRLTAKDFAPELLELYDYYAHGKINRREFLDRAALFTFGGLTAGALLAALSPNYALAEQVEFTDPDILAEYITYPSPKG